MAGSDLAGVPGGDALAELAKQINGNPDAIISIAGVWSNAAVDSSTQTGNFQATAKEIIANWTGAGSDSFTTFKDSFETASKQINDSLNTASAALNKAAAALKKAKGNVRLILQQVEGDAQQLRADIAQLQAAKKDASQLEAELNSLAKNASPKVKAEIKQAEDELNLVIADLNKAITTAEKSYSALKIPGSGTVTPHVGTGGTPGGGTPTGGGTPAGGSTGDSSGSAGGSSGGGGMAGDTGAHTASAAANQALALSIIKKDFPQWNNPTQWNDLLKLWNQESGWSNTAQNPSGAFGIAQSLPPTKMPLAAQPTSLGGSADPTAQIQWGLQYILGRYGSPAAAWAHEVAMNWY